jgi:hypothetical protein
LLNILHYVIIVNKLFGLITNLEVKKMNQRLKFVSVGAYYMRWIALNNEVTIEHIANEIGVTMEDIRGYDSAVAMVRSYNRRTESGSAGSNFKLNLMGHDEEYHRVSQAIQEYRNKK